MKLFWTPHRSLLAFWMLEEVECPYERVLIDVQGGQHASADFLAVNPSGRVPALRHGVTSIAEPGAICAYLADRFPEAQMAPPPGHPDRGCYLEAVFLVGRIEAASRLDERVPADVTRGLAALAARLHPGPWLLGEQFSAADVMLGAVLHAAPGLLDGVADRAALEGHARRSALRSAFRQALSMDRDERPDLS